MFHMSRREFFGIDHFAAAAVWSGTETLAARLALTDSRRWPEIFCIRYGDAGKYGNSNFAAGDGHGNRWLRASLAPDGVGCGWAVPFAAERL